mgnify:CR=1 FL=1
MSIIGKNIRYLRKQSKMSQSKLGELVNKSESTIQMWETGYRSPTMGSVKTLSEVFNVDINSLMEIDMQINNIKDANIYNDANISFIKVPLYGDISCGKGSFVDDNIIDYIAVPDNNLNPNNEYFAQYAKGDSMINAGIDDGDVIVFEKTNILDDNKIGCFCIDEGIATCKKFKKGPSYIQLIPMNPKYDPKVIDLENENFRIVGKLRKVIKDFE